MKDPWLFALALAAMVTSGSAAPPRVSLDEAVNSLTAAIAANDSETVDRWLAADWEIVDASGKMIGKKRFMEAVRSQELVHESMALDDAQVRIVGDSTLWIARARGSGRYRGAPFEFDERSTSLWRMRDGRWVCLFTQLTAIAPNHQH